MDYEIISLNIGQPKMIELQGKRVITAFIKEAVKGKVWLSKEGFHGDSQADKKNHGGVDKALLMYPIEHYQYWEDKYQRKFSVPSFGENVTIKGLTEDLVKIGDECQLGDAIIQVSQSRQPCFKIAGIHNLKDITALVTRTGYVGYYFRVLKEGYVSNRDTLHVIKRGKEENSIASVHQLLFHDRKNQIEMEKLMQHDELAQSVKNTLSNRIAKLKENR